MLFKLPPLFTAATKKSISSSDCLGNQQVIQSCNVSMPLYTSQVLLTRDVCLDIGLLTIRICTLYGCPKETNTEHNVPERPWSVPKSISTGMWNSKKTKKERRKHSTSVHLTENHKINSIHVLQSLEGTFQRSRL